MVARLSPAGGLITSTSCRQSGPAKGRRRIRIIGAISDWRSKYFPMRRTMAEQACDAQVTPWFGVVVRRARSSRSSIASARGTGEGVATSDVASSALDTSRMRAERARRLAVAGHHQDRDVALSGEVVK